MMKNEKKMLFGISLFMLFWVMPSFAQEAKPLYLAHNVWFEKPSSVSAIGYKRGSIIPAGTKVENVHLASGRHSGVEFRIPEWDLDIKVVIGGHQKDKLTAVELRDRMISDKPLEELLDGFTDQEIECVKKGYIAPGIRKEAALMAYGYPPLHRTPSTKMPSWTYWKSRFVTRSVRFNEEGKAMNGIGN